MDRRDFTKRIAQASSFAVLTASARRTAAALPSSPSPETPLMAHTLPTLPYDFAALEPHIDAQTMQIHHGKHHQAYVNNLNAAIEKAPELASWSLDDLCRNIAKEIGRAHV